MPLGSLFGIKALAIPGLLVLGCMLSVTALAEEPGVPDFTLVNIQGEEVSLSDLLSAGPVILDFWATWCKPCLKAFPGLQSLLNDYGDRGLSVVTVSVDGPKSRARVAPLIRSKKYTFEVVFDSQGRVARKYGAMSLPRTLLISPEGEIVHATVGYRPSNHADLERLLVPLLAVEPAREGEVGE
jgi:peroxiredoxin